MPDRHEAGVVGVDEDALSLPPRVMLLLLRDLLSAWHGGAGRVMVRREFETTAKDIDGTAKRQEWGERTGRYICVVVLCVYCVYVCMSGCMYVGVRMFRSSKEPAIYPRRQRERKSIYVWARRWIGRPGRVKTDFEGRL